jgi:integrase
MKGVAIQAEGEAYTNFTGSIRTMATLKHYLFLIQRYAAFRKTQDLNEIIAKDTDDQRLAAAQVKEFLLSLQTKGLSQGSIRNYRNALKHFYEMNDIALNWKKISKFARMEQEHQKQQLQQKEPIQPRKKDRAYRCEEIQKMLEKSNEKARAIILLLASSGMRLEAIPFLTLGNLTKITNNNHNFTLYQILVYAGSNDEHTTFCTPEAAKAIDSYLSYRKQQGERLNPNTPLFRNDFDASDLFKVRNNIKPIGNSGISFLVRQSLERAGLLPIPPHPVNVRHEVQRNHGFRKFANTQMIQSDMKGAAKEMLLGHSIGLDDKYYRPTTAQLLEEYLKAVDLLTISEENRLRKKVEELTPKSDEMQAMRDELNGWREQSAELKSAMDELRARVRGLNK